MPRSFLSFVLGLSALLFLPLSQGCGSDETPVVCLGDEAFCGMRYDELAYATTHNAYAVDALFDFSNQSRSITQQLRDGVRALMLDVYDGADHELGEELFSCHGVCDRYVGVRLFSEDLAEIVRFLNENPREIVTIIFESYAPPEKLRAVFEAEGALALTRAQKLDEPWPTLEELIDQNERLLVFSDRDGFAYDWHLPVFEFMRETPYAAQVPEDLRCEGGRGAEDARLLIFNHFLTQVVGSADLAERINHEPFLSQRIRDCEEALGQKVNFITVDYYEIGDVLSVVERINVERASGR